MPISVSIAVALLLAVAGMFWYVARRGTARPLTLSVSGTFAALAVLLFLGAITATIFGGRPFGLESLKRPYEAFVQRFEHPTQPLISFVSPRS